MKEEITEELRQLRKNIEQDRDQDRIQLHLLQRQHADMADSLSRATADRERLEAELAALNDTVTGLQEQVDKKSAQYDEMKKLNDELKLRLEDKTSDMRRQIQQMEREKDDLQRALRSKEIEYKRLQNMLETIKEEHEERLTRLKNINKEKITLEKQVQNLGKEKKNLDVKMRSLEQHYRLVQENHSRDTGNLKLQLERTRSLLEEKEREKSGLERQLQDSVRENDGLRQQNQRLGESLQKSQDEKAHLQHKVHQAELSSYAIPPFIAGNKSNRPGWKPGRTNWK